MTDKTSITYKEWSEGKRNPHPPSPPPVFAAPLTQKEWDQRFHRQLHRYYEDPKTRAKAFDFAHETTVRKHGPRPDGPPSAMGIGWRIFWLVKVKGMDWKKLLQGAVGSFIAGAAGVLAHASADGVTPDEWWMVLTSGLIAVGVFLKEPNKKGFAHPTKKQ